ncbi:MAG: class I SAM-dependent methyltransferase [Promethearchaeota archaeon]|nr:MAG: class I SAM-dependent methyltransferase [Candidatus Lokiarchaeota archaeon]
MMKFIKFYILSNAYYKRFQNLFNRHSIIKLIKNPIKWISKNNYELKILLRYSVFYLFINPKLKLIDREIEGMSLPMKQGRILYNYARKLPKNSTIVEIGAYLGRSTCFIAEGIKNKKINFYSIDNFEYQFFIKNQYKPHYKNGYQYRNEFYKNVYRYRNKIKIIKGFSYNVVNDFQNEKIDMFWLDASHRYEACKRDIEDWLPLVNIDGYLIFHDYSENSGNICVKKAVDEKIREGKLKKIKRIDNLLITKKIA